MKRFLRYSLVLGLLASVLISCDNEIDINAEYQDLTIIYGMLDPRADTNYVRIQRGYLGDAAASASYGQSDSLYYDSTDISVVIREYEYEGNVVLREAPLIYDDNIELEEGIFTGEGHHLYRVPSSFNIERDKEYEVVVTRLADGSVASARTGIVGSLDLRQPSPFLTARFFDGRIEFRVNQDIDVSTPEATVKMTAYQATIYFHYKEVDLRTGAEVFKTEEIRLPLEESTFDEQNLLFDGGQLNAALAGRIEEDPDKNILRFFQSMDIAITGASEELMTYIDLNRPATGVNQNRPQYEQVINGTGILSSRTSIYRDEIKLQPRVYDRLLVSSTTCDLNFARVERNGLDTCICDNNQKQCF